MDNSLAAAAVAAGIIGFCAGVTAAWFLTVDEYKRARRARAQAQEQYVMLKTVMANMHVLQAAATAMPVAQPDGAILKRSDLN